MKKCKMFEDIIQDMHVYICDFNGAVYNPKNLMNNNRKRREVVWKRCPHYVKIHGFVECKYHGGNNKCRHKEKNQYTGKYFREIINV